jgi:DedD protein
VERPVKERLVGAAVLMAAAVILIPEMLSGPDREPEAADAQAKPARNDAPIKTYTIDLSQSPGSQTTAGIVENRAPPPEQMPVPQPAAEQPVTTTQVKPESAPEPTPPVVEPPTAVAAAPERTPSRPLASAAGAPTSAGWAVQVGSFSKEATAERLAKQLRTQGHAAFVMPVESGAATLYRVRIGPEKDRAGAEAVLRDVKATAPGAAVVAHPR